MKNYAYIYAYVEEKTFDLSKSVYIGKQNQENVRNFNRGNDHVNPAKDKQADVFSQLKYVLISKVPISRSIDFVEAWLIEKYKPKYNTLLNPDKSNKKQKDLLLTTESLTGETVEKELDWYLFDNPLFDSLSIDKEIRKIDKINSTINKAKEYNYTPLCLTSNNFESKLKDNIKDSFIAMFNREQVYLVSQNGIPQNMFVTEKSNSLGNVYTYEIGSDTSWNEAAELKHKYNIDLSGYVVKRTNIITNEIKSILFANWEYITSNVYICTLGSFDGDEYKTFFVDRNESFNVVSKEYLMNISSDYFPCISYEEFTKTSCIKIEQLLLNTKSHTIYLFDTSDIVHKIHLSSDNRSIEIYNHFNQIEKSFVFKKIVDIDCKLTPFNHAFSLFYKTIKDAELMNNETIYYYDQKPVFSFPIKQEIISKLSYESINNDAIVLHDKVLIFEDGSTEFVENNDERQKYIDDALFNIFVFCKYIAEYDCNYAKRVHLIRFLNHPKTAFSYYTEDDNYLKSAYIVGLATNYFRKDEYFKAINMLMDNNYLYDTIYEFYDNYKDKFSDLDTEEFEKYISDMQSNFENNYIAIKDNDYFHSKIDLFDFYKEIGAI